MVASVQSLLVPPTLSNRHCYGATSSSSSSSQNILLPTAIATTKAKATLTLTSRTTSLHAATPTEDEKERKELVDALFKGSSSSSSSNNNSVQEAPTTELLNQIDGFLDKPFFDPYAYEDDDDSFLGKLARLVKADYELFEALFVAIFFLFLITIAKDLLRAQIAASGVAAAGKLF